MIEKIFEDIKKHFLVYFFILLAIVYGLVFGHSVAGLVLFSLAIGIYIGQETPK